MSHRQVDEKVTVSRVEAMLRADDNEGICVLCGADASGVEPDAEAYTCEICNQEGVYGAEQLLLLGLYR